MYFLFNWLFHCVKRHHKHFGREDEIIFAVSILEYQLTSLRYFLPRINLKPFGRNVVSCVPLGVHILLTKGVLFAILNRNTDLSVPALFEFLARCAAYYLTEISVVVFYSVTGTLHSALHRTPELRRARFLRVDSSARLYILFNGIPIFFCVLHFFICENNAASLGAAWPTCQ